MSHTTTGAALPALTIGLDLGDRKSTVYAVDAQGACVECRSVPTTPEGLRAYFAGKPAARVVLEVGTHSPWVSRVLADLVAEVFVANPSAMYGRGRRRARRNDRMDAEFLARQGRADPALLHPIRHRRETAQHDLELVRARDVAVRARTALINHVRGAVKSTGARLPAHDAHRFPSKVRAVIPEPLQDALAPLLAAIETLSATITQYDRQIEALQARYPITAVFRQVCGVGHLTAIAFACVIDEPTRFVHSRQVGAYLGFTPRLDESGAQSPQLGISKHGDPLMRRLLVNAAHYILGPFGPPCALRRFGEAIMVRGGPNAKKRAVVAVARKLAVLLHHLWITGREYVPDPTAARSPAAA